MIGILDYGMGNLRSVANAFLSIDTQPKLIDRPDHFDTLTHLVIPGVGAFRQAMENLNNLGMPDAIRAFALSGRPILGICLGMQLLSSEGFEPLSTPGLEIIEGKVVRFNGISKPIPHIGWNSIIAHQNCYLFDGIKKDADFYFVHSYYFEVRHYENILAECNYGINFAAAVIKNNIVGLQFHPEKSQKNGLKILSNFIHYNP